MRTNIKQEKEMKCNPKLEPSLLVRTQSGDFQKEGAQLPNYLLWLSEASTKMRPPPTSKESTLLSVLMFCYTGVINCWWNKPVLLTVLGAEG